ncbi:MAG: glucosyltransferase domain-containing protein [Roseburia sp.]|nr:glucosyltransferase domain-containing protein [Roseburia sp.]
MRTPAQAAEQLKNKWKPQGRLAFVAAFVQGLLIHMPILLSDIPNHDGLDSMYFDQNMITSGRWFLTYACGISSYFTIPWVIGLLGFLFLGLTAAALTELLELRDKVIIVLVSGLLVAFPALTSTFAYVYTLDGYMLALFLAVLAVLLTKKYRFGFTAGAVCLGCSLGVYQAYLPFAVFLCMYMGLLLFMEEGALRGKLKGLLRYLYMGILGLVFYYGALRLLLLIQGKELASYQGINGEGSAGIGLIQRIAACYRDFAAFTFRGNVLYNNIFSGTALLLLAFAAVFAIIGLCRQKKLWRKPSFFVMIGLMLLGLPIAANVILIVSPQVNYHLLMRYQWGLLLILGLALVDKAAREPGRGMTAASWGAVLAAAVLVLHYGVSDNIAYSNLEKRYEKTYAYCLRLLDRIEQTEGYYQGIPIAMIGVVGDEQYPVTDITGHVTRGMIGMNGDSLLYTGANYEAFMKHYLGATLNFLEPEVMAEIYYSPEYMEMDSFPGENSVKVVDGILYIKTENSSRD